MDVLSRYNPRCLKTDQYLYTHAHTHTHTHTQSGNSRNEIAEFSHGSRRAGLKHAKQKHNSPEIAATKTWNFHTTSQRYC